MSSDADLTPQHTDDHAARRAAFSARGLPNRFQAKPPGVSALAGPALWKRPPVVAAAR